LNRLNVSTLNCNERPSARGIFLDKAKSKFVLLGLRRKLRPAFPNVNPVGATKRPGLPIRGPNVLGLEKPTGGGAGLATTSGYEAGPETLTIPALSGPLMPSSEPALSTLKGVPDWNTVIP
jgi:hypothetical protein